MRDEITITLTAAEVEALTSKADIEAAQRQRGLDPHSPNLLITPAAGGGISYTGRKLLVEVSR
jgi:hypothetical protein